MKKEEMLSMLGDIGWRCSKDEVGDCYCLMDVGKARVQIIPSIGRRSDHFRVSLTPSVSTEGFTKVAEFILGENVDFEPIIVSNEVPKKIANISQSDIMRLSQDAILWANKQDLSNGLRLYRELPTNSKGARPLRHLAALALNGDVECLTNYRNNFVQGDRLGFVPYITSEIIDRAILAAQEKGSIKGDGG